MAVPIVLSFSVVDYIFRPDLFLEFLGVRMFILPVSLMIYFLLKKNWGETYFVSMCFTAFLGLYSAYLTWRTGGGSSIYYAGLNLVAVGSMGFVPWPAKKLPLVTALIYGPFLATLFFDSNINAQTLIPNLAFMGSTIFVAIVIHYLTSRLRWAEVEARLKLGNEIETKDQVIEDKTRHGVFLEKLAMQFSPQVIDAIKGGSLNIEDRVRRSISCIFIDIENSTGRSARLDYSEYSDILSAFFSECIDILLNHDITVGTYLGDGLMAFSNAPMESQDHQLAALSACLDILKVHRRKFKYYSDRWRSPFNIRIGINTGFALVGFFPNPKRGTYTAVGDVINLASRLCGKAHPNTVCVTKDFLKDLSGKLEAVKIERSSNTDAIKGFEGEHFELFAITNLNTSSEESAQSMCPLCGNQLFVAESLGQVDVVRCTGCNYHDLVDKVPEIKAA